MRLGNSVRPAASLAFVVFSFSSSSRGGAMCSTTRQMLPYVLRLRGAAWNTRDEESHAESFESTAVKHSKKRGPAEQQSIRAAFRDKIQSIPACVRLDTSAWPMPDGGKNSSRIRPESMFRRHTNLLLILTMWDHAMSHRYLICQCQAIVPESTLPKSLGYLFETSPNDLSTQVHALHEHVKRQFHMTDWSNVMGVTDDKQNINTNTTGASQELQKIFKQLLSSANNPQVENIDGELRAVEEMFSAEMMQRMQFAARFSNELEVTSAGQFSRFFLNVLIVNSV